MIAQVGTLVKAPGLPTSPQHQLVSPLETMIHHKVSPRVTIYYRMSKDKHIRTRPQKPYGVSVPQKVLPPGLLLKRWGEIVAFLAGSLGLHETARETVGRLLRLWCYYGEVYAKAEQICALPGCPRITFWRTVKRLQEKGLIKVVNRYIRREKAQISNLYLLDKLILMIARYLAERGERFATSWLTPFLALLGREFWGKVWEVKTIWELVGRTRPILAW